MLKLLSVVAAAVFLFSSPALGQYCGLGDCDETSEVLSVQGQSWIINATPAPGVCPTNTLSHHHFVISELCVGMPDEAEFVELCNQTGQDVYLKNIWLTDDCNSNDNDYVKIVKNTQSPPANDFVARFPAQAWLMDGDCIVIAPRGDLFYSYYGFYPDFEIKSVSPAPDMILYGGGTAASDFFTDAGEMVLAFCWRGDPGVSGPDVLCDIDYVHWGNTSTAVDKTGICIDGPDPGTGTTCYFNDTNPMFQFIMNADNDADPEPHDAGKSAGRQYCKDAQEYCSGGNACMDGTVPVEIFTWGVLKAMYR